MKIRNLILAGVGLILLLVTSFTAAQSLGDVARQERAKRAKEAKKPVKVFTNDNLPARPPSEGPTAVGSMSSAPAAEQAPTLPSEVPIPPGAGEPKAEDKQQTREYWQDRFRAASQTLKDDEEQQRLAEDELSLLQIQQARELDPDTQKELEAQVTDKKAEVEAKRAQTARAKKALDDLEKDFKESGAPADWIKTE